MKEPPPRLDRVGRHGTMGEDGTVIFPFPKKRPCPGTGSVGSNNAGDQYSDGKRSTLPVSQSVISSRGKSVHSYFCSWTRLPLPSSQVSCADLSALTFSVQTLKGFLSDFRDVLSCDDVGDQPDSATVFCDMLDTIGISDLSGQWRGVQRCGSREMGKATLGEWPAGRRSEFIHLIWSPDSSAGRASLCPSTLLIPSGNSSPETTRPGQTTERVRSKSRKSIVHFRIHA